MLAESYDNCKNYLLTIIFKQRIKSYGNIQSGQVCSFNCTESVTPNDIRSNHRVKSQKAIK